MAGEEREGERRVEGKQETRKRPTASLAALQFVSGVALAVDACRRGLASLPVIKASTYGCVSYLHPSLPTPPSLGHNKWQQQHFVSSPLSLFRTLYLPVASLSRNANSKSRARGDNVLMTCSTTLHVAGNWPSSRGRGERKGVNCCGSDLAIW